MMLKEIIENKRKEIEKSKRKFPLSSFKSKLKKSDRDFEKAISGRLRLIAEVKKASPSEGIIRTDFNIKQIIEIYDKYADAISVLTDKKFFSGDLKNIKEAKRYTDKPILRKDFIIDEYQIYESRHYGADAILLIASALTEKQIDKFIGIAKKYSMDCLVEVRTMAELDKVLRTRADIIGINNRNLDTLKINLNTTLRLADKIPKNKIIVSESGFKSKKDIEKLKGKVNAFLIGTAFMKSRDIEGKIMEFKG